MHETIQACLCAVLAVLVFVEARDLPTSSDPIAQPAVATGTSVGPHPAVTTETIFCMDGKPVEQCRCPVDGTGQLCLWQVLKPGTCPESDGTLLLAKAHYTVVIVNQEEPNESALATHLASDIRAGSIAVGPKSYPTVGHDLLWYLSKGGRQACPRSDRVHPAVLKTLAMMSDKDVVFLKLGPTGKNFGSRVRAKIKADASNDMAAAASYRERAYLIIEPQP